MRARSGKVSHRKRLAVRKYTKGMSHPKRVSFRLGKQAVVRSLQYAYRDRRNRKRDFKRLWIQRINAGTRANGTKYSTFMKNLETAGITLDRKVLAQLAFEEPEAFTALIKSVTKK